MTAVECWESVDVETLMWRNVTLLGFDAADAFKRYPGASFGPDMFRKSNPKGLIVITHFLFTRKDPAQARIDFAHVWPVMGRDQDYEFRTVVLYNLLHALELSDQLPRGTTLKSHLTQAFGPRVCNVVWHLSSHVLEHVFRSEHPQLYADMVFGLPDPKTIPGHLLAAHDAALQDRVRVQIALLQRALHERVNTDTHLQSLIDKIADEYRQQHSRQGEVEDAYRRSTRENDAEAFTEIANVHRVKKVELLQSAWSRILELLREMRTYRDEIERVTTTDGVEVSRRLDGHDLVAGAHVNLVDLIDSFSETLESLQRSVDLPNGLDEIHEKRSWSSKCAHVESNRLKSMRELVDSLGHLVPVVQSSVNDLRQQVSHGASEGPVNSLNMSPQAPKLSLVPPTPMLPAQALFRQSRPSTPSSVLSKPPVPMFQTSGVSAAMRTANKPPPSPAPLHLKSMQKRRLSFGTGQRPS